MAVQNPVIVVPGITASRLSDWYPVSPETVWSALKKDYAKVALHPDDLRYERAEPARVVADKVFTIPYDELIADLRHDLRMGFEHPAPVFPFEYDWRQSLAVTEERLAEFVQEVIARTKLIPYYTNAWRKNPRVDFVGHSMGGLIVTGYLQRFGTDARAGRVATLGTPYRGSFEAALKITTGLAELGQDRQTAREREAARMTPSLYHLLPDIPGALEVADGLPDSLYDPGVWQPSVVSTIADYVEAYSIGGGDPERQARRIFKELLDEAKAHRVRILGFKPKDAGMAADDWLVMIGVDYKTRVGLRIVEKNHAPFFDLSSTLRRNGYASDDPAARVETGDGTVPYLGAKPPFIPVEKLVCVTPDDFGYWEWGDRLLEGPVGLHGMLPKMNLINRVLASFFTNKRRKGTWGRPAPDLADPKAWDPPVKGLKRR